MPKSACFDVLGTCFDFAPTISAIDSRIGPKLKAVNVDSKSLFFSWFYAAQRDFTYLSIVDAYKPIAQILAKTFRRACQVVDLPADQVTDEDVAAITKCLTSLPARPDLKQCFDGLREAGWDVYAVTNGGKETSLNYYKQANIELDTDHLLSCDDLGVAKPDLRVYERANEHLTAQGLGKKGDGERWFVAAHAWDLIAARKAGFKTAWLGFEEHDPCTDVFGKFDVYAEDYQELLKKMKAV
ncbi:hypothetical protein LTR53_005598 [Teratosphaeriaceae sp. CCFEE 6253]|nr:hypothetical protein LTR53_005598 [Teratosphaeriaceae sp. CCFEE 6253]